MWSHQLINSFTFIMTRWPRTHTKFCGSTSPLSSSIRNWHQKVQLIKWFKYSFNEMFFVCGGGSSSGLVAVDAFHSVLVPQTMLCFQFHAFCHSLFGMLLNWIKTEQVFWRFQEIPEPPPPVHFCCLILIILYSLLMLWSPFKTDLL